MFPFALTIVPECFTTSNHVNTNSWLPLLTIVQPTIYHDTLHTKFGHIFLCSLKELNLSTTQKKHKQVQEPITILPQFSLNHWKLNNLL